MPFKIVQTVESGIRTLSIVPSIWEEKGKLFWPPEKIKNRTRLIRDEKSLPTPNWNILQCQLKRNNIPTYKAAEVELAIMQNCTDTDNDTAKSYCQPPPAHQTTNDDQPEYQNMNFEDLTNDLIYNAANVGTSLNNRSTTVDNLNIPMINIDQLIANQNVILVKMNEQEKAHNEILENVKRLTQKVAMLSVQLDENLTKIIEKIDQPLSVTLLKDSGDNNESFFFKQIENKMDLEELEAMLNDKDATNKLQKKFSFLCQPTDGNGITFAYKLLDCMISREFLTQCSWSGGSRGDISKVALKDFKNILHFFFRVIRSWDSQFTIEQNEWFFKNILKNAVKRKYMKGLRASGKRFRRPKTNENKNEARTSNENQASTSKENKASTSEENKASTSKENKASTSKENKAFTSKQNKASTSEENKASTSKENKAFTSKQNKASKSKDSKVSTSQENTNRETLVSKKPPTEECEAEEETEEEEEVKGQEEEDDDEEMDLC